MIEDLKILHNHLGNLESGLYLLCITNDADGNKIEHDIDRLIGDLQFAMIDLEILESKVKLEQDLIDKNETLRALYEEYTVIRDLIGSEK